MQCKCPQCKWSVDYDGNEKCATRLPSVQANAMLTHNGPGAFLWRLLTTVKTRAIRNRVDASSMRSSRDRDSPQILRPRDRRAALAAVEVEGVPLPVEVRIRMLRPGLDSAREQCR